MMLLKLFFFLIPYSWVFKGLGNLLSLGWWVLLCAGTAWVVLDMAAMVCSFRPSPADVELGVIR